MPDNNQPDKPKFRLGDDGELYNDDNPTEPIQKLKRKAKPSPNSRTPIILGLIVVLLMLVGCLLTLNLISSRLTRVIPTPVVLVATSTPRLLPTLLPSVTLVRTALPTLTPTLVVTPPTIGIGERPRCTGIGGNERIVFDTVYGDDNREIYLLDLSQDPDSNICRLTDNPLPDIDPVWHPNGQRVLFNRNGDLWLVDGSGVDLAPSITGNDGQWDESGDWTVFAGAVSGNIEVALLDGSQRRLVSDMPLWDEYEPDCCGLALLPLQAVIAFASAPRQGEQIGTSNANEREIFTVNADGTGRTQLTNNSVDDNEPDWSPGGNQIVFTHGRYGFNTDIWSMNADGSNPIQLTEDDATDHSPRWLPDGRIMFVSERGRAGAIYVMNADGSNVQAITAPLGVLTFDYWAQ